MTHMEHVRALRADTDTHYNCCQSVLIPFAAEMGMTAQQAYALGSHFGGGMRHAATCGAFSGAMMVMGALGYDEKQAAALIRQFKENHGATYCVTLLKASHDRGEVKKEHCDGLVYEMVEMLSELVANR